MFLRRGCEMLFVLMRLVIVDAADDIISLSLSLSPALNDCT
jgi:hypothetical protein